MKTITDSLKNFYAKLGGNPSNLPSRSTSADIIDAMSDVYTDKEGTHVEVTTQVTEGTKIATVKTNNEDHDIYAPVELPSVTSADEGKVLTVDSNGDWGADDIPSELPTVTSSDEGKVLTVDSEGAWGAATPSGGGSGVTFLDVTEVVVSDQHRLTLPDNLTAEDLVSRMTNGEYIVLRLIDQDLQTYFTPISNEPRFTSFVAYDGSCYCVDSAGYSDVNYLVMTQINFTVNE